MINAGFPLVFFCCFNHSEIKSSLFTRTPNQTLLKDERRRLLERFQVPLGSSDYNSDGVSVEHDGGAVMTANRISSRVSFSPIKQHDGGFAFECSVSSSCH